MRGKLRCMAALYVAVLGKGAFDIAADAAIISSLPLADHWRIASARRPRRGVVRTIVAGEPRGLVANLCALPCGEHAAGRALEGRSIEPYPEHQYHHGRHKVTNNVLATPRVDRMTGVSR